ncbi:MAG: UDP-N-acetylmuramoyl-L-alanyl-D-glutamate--2,6-diaminopimelate ligase [Acidobacteriota bacterium]|nr:UDP-N-acetylmuramoyl-L-alanyl-D-glutamate--2,6-diaminopimelate ligase [Acidobacteriota bacterium]
MILKEILKDIPVVSFSGDDGLEILDIVHSSKSVVPGSLFVALKGEKTDGMDFVRDAENGGAAAVLADRARPADVRLAWIQVPNARRAMGEISAVFFGRPSDALTVIGITGTKGKTTTAYLLESIFKTAGFVPGVIGTIEYRGPGIRIEAARTTPEAPDLQRMMADMQRNGATHVIMEVSSHALEQDRVHGTHFDVALFTNLSGEHMDYHGSMENYFESKKKLFFLNHKRKASVVNIDDPWGRKLFAELPMRAFGYGLGHEAVVRAENFQHTPKGLEVKLVFPGGRKVLSSSLVGRHNVQNILAAAGAALALEIPSEAVAAGIAALPGVPGRFEAVPNSRGLHIVVDYAHTDSALRHALETARDFRPKRLIAVFGAGGNRDKSKRPRMGAVAAALADLSIITSDNPRREDPAAIIADIEAGFKEEAGSGYEIVVDRKEAIRRALSLARPDDFVIVAGKGHENTQTIGDRVLPFSDVDVIAEILAEETS